MHVLTDAGAWSAQPLAPALMQTCRCYEQAALLFRGTLGSVFQGPKWQAFGVQLPVLDSSQNDLENQRREWLGGGRGDRI